MVLLEISTGFLNAKEYLVAIGIILFTLFVAKIYSTFYKRFITHLIKRAKLRFGGVVNAWSIILESLEKPIYWAIVLAGIYFALSPLIATKFVALYHKVYLLLAISWGLLSTIKIIDKLIKWNLSKEKITKDRKTIFLSLKNIVNIFLFVIAAILVLSTLEIEITPLIASLGIVGLAMALALQPTLANYFSGIYVTMDHSIRVGDYIKLEENDLKGYVENIGWRSTRIRNLRNNLIIIPNAKLTDMIVTNYHAPVEEMAVVVQCGVSYRSNLEKVEKVTIEVAREVLSQVPGGVKEFNPFIRYHTFGESNIQFSIILRVREVVNRYSVIHEFIKALKKRFDQEGIEISLPTRNIYLREATFKKRKIS